MTENKKFSLKVIEKGRLSQEEANQVVGGLAKITSNPEYKPLCQGFYGQQECLIYTVCQRVTIMDLGYENCPPNGDGTLRSCENYSNKS